MHTLLNTHHMLHSVLPPPRQSYTSIQPTHSTPRSNHQHLEIVRLNAKIPPYGQRQGYIPREPEDFGDGGAFPEIFIKQYPLDMGRQDLNKNTSSVVPLKVNEKGEVQYDAILRENMRKNQIMHSKHKDLVDKDDVSEDELMKPSEDTAMEATEATRKALEKMINQQIESIRPAHSHKPNKPVTVRYQSANSTTNGAPIQSRLIKIYEMPSDPLDPPKFRHKKLPPRPPSPPVPIMHSPPRQVTVEDQKNWKVPPCVSNWKNNKGFTLPLHQRLAADGRGLYNHVINDKFAKFSEALLIAERQARKEVEARAQMRLKLSKKQKQQKEKELAAMAKSAKEATKYNQYVAVDKDKEDTQTQQRQRDTSEYDRNARRNRKRKRRDEESDSSEDSDSSQSSNDSEDDERRKAYEERENIRRERERERKRQYRLDRKKTGKNNSVRQRERDISERIALGQFSGKKSTQSLYDNRLFNQDSGLNTGFAADDTYHLYDKPLFHGKSRKIYRPTVDEEMYGMDGGDVLNERSDKIRPHKGFEGAEENRNGRTKRRFEFEKDEEESKKEGDDGLEEELNRFTTVKERKQANGHHKGYMYAAGGGGNGMGNRDKVMFEVGKETENEVNGTRKGGLYYSEEEMKKKRERREREREERSDKRERHRHYTRSRSRSRSPSRDRDRRHRRTHRRSRSRSRSHSRERREKRSRRHSHEDDRYETRGRWRGGD
eukprot:206799_1